MYVERVILFKTQVFLSIILKTFLGNIMFSLRTDDIEGARPLLKGYQFINKPEYSNYTLDIEKAFPRPLHPRLNKPCRNLSTNDIEKAQPCEKSFKSSRNTNPLNPEYKLPTAQVQTVTPCKFIRDSLKNDDIEGSKPEKQLKWSQRDNITVKDIEGACPKQLKLLQRPDSLKVQDISEPAQKKPRMTNPLEPTYVISGSEGPSTIGFIEGSKGKPQINTSNPVHRRNLDNSDIEASKAGTLGNPVLRSKSRNYSKNPLDTSDIPGSSAGSHRRGLSTSRVTNPLQPVYVWTVEEPAQIPLPQKVEEKQPEIFENQLKFWGVTPRNLNSRQTRPQTSKPRKSASFRKNEEKFYDCSAEDQEYLLKNAEKFFDNAPRYLSDKFLNVQNPKTIHRMKKEVKVIEPAHFHENLKRFCGDNRPASSGSYLFKLSRGEIARPVE
jgi:hypothetical protein